MIESRQLETDDYFGYNSIIDPKGKRIRRMRRTQNSAQKVSISKLNSANSRSLSAKNERSNKNNSVNSLNLSNDRLKMKCSRYLNQHFYKTNKHETEHLILETSETKKRKVKPLKRKEPVQNIKERFGSYYLGDSELQETRNCRVSREKKENQIRRSKVSIGVSSQFSQKKHQKQQKTSQRNSQYFDNVSSCKVLLNGKISSSKNVKKQQSSQKRTELSQKRIEKLQRNESTSKESRKSLRNKNKSRLSRNLQSSRKIEVNESNLHKEFSQSPIQQFEASKHQVFKDSSNNCEESNNCSPLETLKYTAKESFNDYGLELQTEKNEIDKQSSENSQSISEVTDEEISLSKVSLRSDRKFVTQSKLSINKSKVASKIKLKRRQNGKSNISQAKSSILSIKQSIMQKSKIKIKNKFNKSSIIEQEKIEKKINKKSKIEANLNQHSKAFQKKQKINETPTKDRNNSVEKSNESISLHSIKIEENHNESMKKPIELSKQDSFQHQLSSFINPEIPSKRQISKTQQNISKPVQQLKISQTQKNIMIEQQGALKMKVSRQSYGGLPLSSNCPSRDSNLKSPKKITTKKSIGSYNFNDVAQNIQEHDIRIGFFYLFLDNTKSLYEDNLKFQKLAFLMLKKYLFEKNRMIKSLKGDASCFTLTEVQIPDEVLDKHRDRQQIKERTKVLMEQGKQIFKELNSQCRQLTKKFPKDKHIKIESPKDNFSKEIIRILMQQMNQLYQQLQKDDIEGDKIDQNEQRILEIIEIMFLISQLDGRNVKSFELLDEKQIDFDEFYQENYQKIMETYEYFEKKKD